MDDPDLKLVIGILAVVVLGALGWYFRVGFRPVREPDPGIEPPVAAVAEPASVPMHSLPAPTTADAPMG